MGQSKKKKAKKEKHLSVSNTVNYPEQSEETNTSEETVANTQEWGVAAGGSDCDNVETKKKKKKAKRKCDVTDRSEDCMNKDKVNNKEKENVLGISNMETEKVDKKKKKKKKSDDKGEKKNAKSSQENEELFLKHGEYKEDDKKEETVTVVTSKKINKVKRQENDHMFYANNEQTKERLETEELFIGDGENEINEKKEETPRNAKEKTRKKKVKDEDNNVRHDGSAIKKRKKESCRDTEELLMEYEEKPKSEKKAKKKRKIEEKVEEPLKSVHVDTISSNQICKASQPQETQARPLDLGQWTTAEFNSSQQQHKFLSLMGAFKKGFQPAAAGKGKPNMAMGKEAQQQLQQGLLGQFEHAHSRTMNFNKRGAGLGFTPLSNKKFSIDINACRSVHFDP
ncbi:lysine-rich nucleolar protein 1 isoform X1 [Cynoglossus semilaevis]|uniref:lysine-rich nucleolar protein 1 isoform X1 n=1 Tax=Cynoglossus semilaevis TaxID=244447 RepID=UPI00049725F4|nr:lysine-rich nucleolar protein 1 isoform X1 [Cynoglossus semilaevis]XP_008315505.1 lysine-rich nucleolar protein 1 isoform X1 [Cynoglossus semilaevis]XP_008315506.1 lysine-rich nucleolar protein 1 isoform X1 [Cynoglossus semilaevis]